MGCVLDCYILHSTILERNFILSDSTQVLSVVIKNDEELKDQIFPKEFGGIRSEVGSHAQQCFVNSDDE